MHTCMWECMWSCFCFVVHLLLFCCGVTGLTNLHIKQRLAGLGVMKTFCWSTVFPQVLLWLYLGHSPWSLSACVSSFFSPVPDFLSIPVRIYTPLCLGLGNVLYDSIIILRLCALVSPKSIPLYSLTVIDQICLCFFFNLMIDKGIVFIFNLKRNVFR